MSVIIFPLKESLIIEPTKEELNLLLKRKNLLHRRILLYDELKEKASKELAYIYLTKDLNLNYVMSSEYFNKIFNEHR